LIFNSKSPAFHSSGIKISPTTRFSSSSSSLSLGSPAPSTCCPELDVAVSSEIIKIAYRLSIDLELNSPANAIT